MFENKYVWVAQPVELRPRLVRAPGKKTSSPGSVVGAPVLGKALGSEVAQPSEALRAVAAVRTPERRGGVRGGAPRANARYS